MPYFTAARLGAEKVLLRPRRNLPFLLILGAGKNRAKEWEYLPALSDPATALPSQTSKSRHASFITNPIHCRRRRASPGLQAGTTLPSSGVRLDQRLTRSCCLPRASSSTLHFTLSAEGARSFHSGLLFPFLFPFLAHEVARRTAGFGFASQAAGKRIPAMLQERVRVKIRWWGMRRGIFSPSSSSQLHPHGSASASWSKPSHGYAGWCAPVFTRQT